MIKLPMVLWNREARNEIKKIKSLDIKECIVLEGR